MQPKRHEIAVPRVRKERDKRKKNEIIVKNSINMAKTINPYIQEDQLTPSPKHCGI